MENTESVREHFSDVPDFREFERDAQRPYDPHLDYSRFAFVQPNGNSIGVSFPGKDRKIVRHYTDGRRFRDFRPYRNPSNPGKKCNAKLELWKTKHQTQFIICLDFDKIFWHQSRAAYSEGATISHVDPYAPSKKLGLRLLAERIQKRIGSKGYVFNSTGTGNPKILMVVEYEHIVKTPRLGDLIALANDLFPDYMAEGCIDVSRTAFSSTFIPWEKRYEMRDEIERLEPIKISHSAENIIFQTAEERRVVSATFTYFKNAKVPEELDRPEHCNGFREFICVLTTMSALAKKGFAISQRILARTLGITQQRASQYINYAIKLGLLRVSNGNFVMNKRAKTYKARGKLKRFLKTKISSVLPEKLPTRIRKGTWHGTLTYYAVKCFRTNPEAFLKWVKTLKGHDQGDRMEQALNLYKWLFKIIGRPYRKP